MSDDLAIVRTGLTKRGFGANDPALQSKALAALDRIEAHLEAADDADELAAALEETEQHWGDKTDGGARRAAEALADHRARMELRWPEHLRRKTA